MRRIRKLVIKMSNPDWTVLENKMLEDTDLSWEAKGVLAYLYSKPDDWELTDFEMMKLPLGALWQLEFQGYLKEYLERNNSDEDNQK